jgi:plasmid replication initiation protein
MKNNLVVKDNALVSASYYLSLVEQRLILLGIVEARNNQSQDNEFIIHVNSYISAFNVDDSTAYLTIKEACKRLRGRYFTYQRLINGNLEQTESNWVQSVSYAINSSYVKIKFTDDVMPLITNLERHFTSYQLEQVKDLTSIYSIRLYELLISWKQKKKVELSLAELRLKLGIEPDEYKAMNNFKAKVLDLAVSQINEHTDITAKYDQHKQGRTITGFTFTFKQKPSKATAHYKQRDENNLDLFSVNGMSDKQIAVFSKKLAELPELGNMAKRGDSVEQFADMIAHQLRNPSLQGKYIEHLKKVGFKSK